jgi:hypothetical protein
MRSLVLVLLLVAGALACGKKDDAAKPAPAAAPAPTEPTTTPEPAATPTAPPVSRDERIKELLDGVNKAADCANPESNFKSWCLAAQGWATGTAAELPLGGSALLGLTVTLGTDEPIPTVLADGVSVSILAVRNENGSPPTAQISTINPSTSEEANALKEAMFNLGLVLKGKAEGALVAGELIDFAGTLPGAASNPLKQSERGWSFENPEAVEIRRVGDMWVAAQSDPDGSAKKIRLILFTSLFEPR